MESKQKITIINVISIIMLVICLVLCVGLIIISTSKSSIEIAEKSVEELQKNYASTEETSTTNTWNISATENDNVIATLSENGTLTISGTGDMKDWYISSTTEWRGMREKVKTVIIENGVTNIGNDAFYRCEKIASIEIPSSVTSIGNYAFDYCVSLASIEVEENNTVYKDQNGVLYKKDGTEIIKYPEGKSEKEYVILEGVTSIGDGAFFNCKSITSIEIPSSVTSIEHTAFENCKSLISIEIPNSVTNIGGNTFRSCTSLANIQISSSITSIGSQAFYECKSLTSIKIPSSVTSIGWCAFEHCASLTGIEVEENNSVYKDDNGVLYKKDGTEIIKYPEGKSEKEYVILEGVTSIGNGAFFNCKSITSIEIPSSVTSIESRAFEYCKSLRSIEIPSSVTSIGSDTFYGAIITQYIGEGIKVVELHNILKRVQDKDDILYSNEISYINCTIENSKIKMDDEASYGKIVIENGKLSGLAYVLIYNSWDISATENDNVKATLLDDGTLSISGTGDMKDWGQGGNADWSVMRAKVKSVIIENGVTSIGNYAFEFCRSLTSIEISECVTYIGVGAFRECTSLTNIEIPNSVTSIGNYAFDYCVSLASIEVEENNTVYKDHNGVLYKKDGTEIIKYPEGKSEKEYAILEGVTSIRDGVFFNCKSITSIEIPSSVTSIRHNAFYGCESLISIEIPSSVTSIEWCTFYGCKSLTNIKIPSSVTSIGHSVFNKCTSLTKIEVEENNKVYKDDNGVLYTKSGTKIIKYPEGNLNTEYTILTGTMNIGDSAFSECDSLTSIEIPESVKIIGNYAFDGCDKLTIICNKGSTAETYVKENENNYIIMSKINPKTTIEEMRTTIESNIEYEIVNKEHEEISVTAYTATGHKIIVNRNDVHTLIVTGDCNGDGKSDIQDIFAINKHRLNNGKLTNEYLLAGDVNEDGKTNVNDIFQINKYRLGIITEL